jgi:hypothetical protein
MSGSPRRRRTARALASNHSRKRLNGLSSAEGLELPRVFVEVETGKGSDALERHAELPPWQKHVVSVFDRRNKLDRLTRDVHFISG